MQILRVQRPESGWFERSIRRSNEDSNEDKGEANCKEEKIELMPIDMK
jgi:hypothetical protein